MTGDCWPTSDQVLLLRAALGGQAWREALDAWRARTNLAELDRASSRLLPLLHLRLERDAPGHPLIGDLAPFREQAAGRTEALVRTAAEAVGVLRAANIETLVLKGMALVARGLVPPDARFMADCDLLVRESAVLPARDVLLAHGWRLEGRLDAELLTVRHAVSFRNGGGQQVDLHWHVLAECCAPGDDQRFWDAAVPATVGGVATRTLGSADMLLHTCVHGLRWSIVPPVRWVPDAMVILRAASATLDWARLVDEARRRVLVLPMLDTLRYLSETFDAPIPSPVLDQLAQVDLPSWAGPEYRVKMRPRTLRRQLEFHWYQHRRLSASGTALGDLARLPAYVSRRWRF